MGFLFLFLFIVVPIIEIAGFVQIGGLLGLVPTLGIVLFTAAAGAYLLRWQGIKTLARAQNNLAHGEMPMREVFDGVCLLLAGAMLLTPGFFTDAIGLLLFVPTFRDMLRAMAGHYLRTHATVIHGHPPQQPHGSPPGQPIIDGEFTEIKTPPETNTNTDKP